VVGTGSVEVACLTRLAKMARSQPTVEISAGKSVEFKPGDYHVMLVGLTRDLKFGENFEFILKFAKSGEMMLTARVSEQGIPAPDLTARRSNGMLWM